MENIEFGNILDSDGLYPNSWKTTLCSHLEQILKKYPDYEPDEYILWLEMTMFMPIQWRSISANIILLDENADVIQKLQLTSDMKVGKPYPNKCMYQLRLKNGRGSVFGVPLRFKTFDELNKVKIIRVAWDIEFTIDNETVHSLQHMTYGVNFVPDIHKRMYSITDYAVCNIICGWEEYAQTYLSWIEQFDFIQEKLYEKNSDKTDAAISDIKEYSICSAYTVQDTWIITAVQKDIRLMSTDYSSIINEQSFGFKHDNNFSDYQKFIDYHEKYYNIS